MTSIQDFESSEISRIIESRKQTVPLFRAGDELRVSFRFSAAGHKRLQVREGLCIGRYNRGLGSSFTLRRIVLNGGVEETFPLYSPTIASIEVIRYGKVRKAKLYYMRKLRGKSARIKEHTSYRRKLQASKEKVQKTS